MTARYVKKQLYSFNFPIKSGNTLLNEKIKIVLGYLIYKTNVFFKELKEKEHASLDPYIPLSKNKLIKLCGKINNYVAVLKYLEENEIISWYKSENGDAKNGSYYRGNQNVKHKGKHSKEPYCRKCRLTTTFWNAVKNNNVELTDVKVPNSELINSEMFVLENYDFQNTKNDFNWNEYYESKNKKEEFNNKLKELEKQFMKDNTENHINVDEEDESSKMLLEILGDLVVDNLPPETGVEEEWELLENLDVKPSEKGFGKFINIG